MSNPVNYKQRHVSSGSSIIISSISSGGLAGNKISGNAVQQIAKTLSSKSSGFNLFGYELRTSTGWDTDLGNGLTKTDGFTVGVNTSCLVAVIYWIYKFVTTGDPSPVPGLQPAY